MKCSGQHTEIGWYHKFSPYSKKDKKCNTEGNLSKRGCDRGFQDFMQRGLLLIIFLCYLGVPFQVTATMLGYFIIRDIKLNHTKEADTIITT